MKTNKILLSYMVLLFIGCIDDKGNYDYKPIESLIPIEITGLDDASYLILSEVNINPELKGEFKEDDYIFTWYTYNPSSAYETVFDTLGKSRNLTFTMKYKINERRNLVFEIKDKNTQYAIQKKVVIYAYSEFSEGWIIAKDENDEADIDFINMSGELSENLFYKSNGLKLKGKSLKVGYQEDNYVHQTINPDGTVDVDENLKALFFISEKDMYIINPEDFTYYKNFEESFYSPQDDVKPTELYVQGGSSPDVVLMNNKKIHTIDGMSLNIGKFSYQKLGDFDLFPNFIPYSRGYTSVLLFCQETCSFLTADTWEMDIEEVDEPGRNSNLKISPIEMEAEMLQLIPRFQISNGGQGWAIMKSTEEDDEYYIFDILANSYNYPFVNVDIISSEMGILNADVYGVHELNNIYFAKGNKLYYYQFGIGEDLQKEFEVNYSFSTGETISFVNVINSKNNSSEEFKYLVVLTNSSSGWTMYRFEMEGNGLSPKITNKAPIINKGSGNARHVIYIC